MIMLNTKDPGKFARERAAFERFLELVFTHDINPLHTAGNAWPRPDITCNRYYFPPPGSPYDDPLIPVKPGEPLAFELADLGLSLKGDFAIEDILHRKIHRLYDNACPMDLVCYTDQDHTLDDIKTLDILQKTVEREGQGPFRYIWYHGSHGVYRLS